MNKVSTNLVKYNGNSYPELGISNGDDLNNVLANLSATLKGIMDKKVSVSDKEMDIYSAIDTLHKNVSEISSDNISFNGNITYDPGTTAAANPLLNKAHKYETSLSGTNFLYAFDLSSLNTDLPANYNLISTRTRAYSMKGNVSRNTLMQDNDNLSGVIQLQADRLPVYIETEAMFNTPNGDIILKSNHPVTSAMTASGDIIFEVKDYTSDKKTNTTISDWSNNISSKILKLDNIKSQIDKFSVSGLENVPNQQGLLSCVGSLYSFCDKLKSDLTSLGKVNMPKLGPCVESTTGSVQDAFDLVYNVQKDQDQKLLTLQESNQNLLSELNGIRDFYSNILSNQSGGSFNINPSASGDGTVPSGGNGCPGGRC